MREKARKEITHCPALEFRRESGVFLYPSRTRRSGKTEFV